MTQYTYLSIDLGALLIPLIFSFHPKIKFNQQWPFYLPAMIMVALPFLVWDEYFTTIGIWGFNPDYLSGLYIGHLPIEEILFFLCIPYACVFSYHCIKVSEYKPISDKTVKITTAMICLALGILLALNFGKYYPTSTFVLLITSLLFFTFVKPSPYLNTFYFTYLILQVPFFITNGLLTGSWIDEAIVWYDDSENLGIRIATIPLEDTFYGMLLILWNIAVYEVIKSRYSKIS
ncbi:lycopene cyclase domain-containing protein [Reichenbachiella agarivorans]|uniref:Lycopene cyclase domain-containing protein n=1 Tax=Reichenbachiella agarivorans TaxID=2979464 RepID=A0ABY6CRQ7_9BACT|nr:lycopene cyclase domain-containing protein [Reichenbachiella agarivorans]UXP32138.1 lycopene cyclase domain-containing protein [Reichenbachiella agarivorans]